MQQERGMVRVCIATLLEIQQKTNGVVIGCIIYRGCNNLMKTTNCSPKHCRQVPPSRNDKPLPKQQSLALLTPMTMFPPQPVASWHDWNCAEPVGKQKLAVEPTLMSAVWHPLHNT